MRYFYLVAVTSVAFLPSIASAFLTSVTSWTTLSSSVTITPSSSPPSTIVIVITTTLGGAILPPSITTIPSHTPTTPPNSPTITAHFSPSLPTSAPRSLISELSSIESTWTAAPVYTTLEAAVYNAAPNSAKESLVISGFDWDFIVQQPWYYNIEANWREIVDGEVSALQQAVDKYEYAEANGSAPEKMTFDGWWIGILVVGGIVVVGFLWVGVFRSCLRLRGWV